MRVIDFATSSAVVTDWAVAVGASFVPPTMIVTVATFELSDPSVAW